MSKAPGPHPLDSLFKAKLRAMSMHQFKQAEDNLRAGGVVHPWLWVEPKNGTQWTLLGRKAHLLWTARPTFWVKNHSLAEYAINTAMREGTLWHESEPGKPAILMMLLASSRYAPKHERTARLMSSALAQTPPGKGERNDGGWIDRLIGILEQELPNMPSEQRQGVYDRVVRSWFLGSLLQEQRHSQADWQVNSATALPTRWPDQTLARVIRLGLLCKEPSDKHAMIHLPQEGRAFLEARENKDAPLSQELLDTLIEDATRVELSGADFRPTGLWMGLDYQAKHEALPATLLEKLSPHTPYMQSTPGLRSLIEQHVLQSASQNAQGPDRRGGVRL